MVGIKESKIKTVLITILAFVVAAIFLFPILWLFSSSFKPSAELFSYPLHMLPQEFTWDNYVKVISDGFMQYVQNSFFVAIVATIICVAVSSTTGYALAIYRNEFKIAGLLFVYFVIGTLVPGDVLMIPQFDVILNVGLYNSIWGVILPTVASTTGIFLFRQFFMATPMSLVEAARIDGASEFHIFMRIMFPLAKPTTVTLIIFSFMWRWNDYLLPLIVLSKQDRYTVQIAIRNYIGNYGVDWNSIIAASIISIIPVLIVFMFLQKYIMGGIATSGMKN